MCCHSNKGYPLRSTLKITILRNITLRVLTDKIQKNCMIVYGLYRYKLISVEFCTLMLQCLAAKKILEFHIMIVAAYYKLLKISSLAKMHFLKLNKMLQIAYSLNEAEA